MVDTKNKNNIGSLPRKSKQNLGSVLELQICGVTCRVNRELLAENCAKLAAVLKENPEDKNVSLLLGEIPTDPDTFEQVARFCHGYDVAVRTENVVRVSVLAYYLGMTEDHRANNLLKKALIYFERDVLPSWNKCIGALTTTIGDVYVLEQAIELGLIDACTESLVAQAIDDPRLLVAAGENDNDGFRPSARRRLFDPEWKPGDLTTLDISLYEPIIRAMVHRQVPVEYVVASLRQYLRTWVRDGEATTLIYKSNNTERQQRQVIEAIQRLLPDNENASIPCTLLLEMLRSAITSGASAECWDGLELRIGKQLDRATLDDLLILCRLYTNNNERYDTECTKRVLKNYCCNYTAPDVSGLIRVAELVDEFLAEVSRDTQLDVAAFVSFSELSASVSIASDRSSDGIYRAIDVYLDKHGWLTESEREAVCGALDCNKMSPEAREHAAQNQRLPLRLVVQVLFVSQLKLRDAVASKGVHGSDHWLDKEQLKLRDTVAANGKHTHGSEHGLDKENEEQTTETKQTSSNKVLEIENECNEWEEIQRGCHGVKQKGNMWKDLKRKLGCTTSIHECNCRVKKKKVQSKIVK